MLPEWEKLNYEPLLERIFNLVSILGIPMVVDKEGSPLSLSGRFNR